MTTTYNKLQILKAGHTLFEILHQEELPVEYLTAVNCIVEDLVSVLEGKISPLVVRDFVISPDFGFIPIIGDILPDGTVKLYREDDNG